MKPSVVDFRTQLAIQRACGTGTAGLCHAFSVYSCDSVKLAQDKEKIN